jgi:hypothetical protein
MRQEGAFDPVRHAGQETLPLHPEIPAVSQIRYIGKYVYEYLTAPNSDGKRWDKLLAPPRSFPRKNNEHSVIENGLADLPNDVMGGPVNPYNLLTVLESLATVRQDGPVSGPGWTGTRYSFTATVEDFITASDIPRPARGTVDVDQQGRVRRLVLTTVVQPPFRVLSRSPMTSPSVASGHLCRSRSRQQTRSTTRPRRAGSSDPWASPCRWPRE